MRALVIGKRHYTNQDAFANCFGRICWIPRAWRDARLDVRLLLMDYHGLRRASSDGHLHVESLPIFDPRSLQRIFALAKSIGADTIVASGDCIIGLLGFRIARRIGARFVFDVYDDYRTFGGYRVFLGWDAFGFLRHRADLVMYASRRMAGEHHFDSAHVVIPNGFNSNQFRPIPQQIARESVKLPPIGRLVGYAGSMAAEYGVSVLVQAVSKLRRRLTDVQLLLCGKEHPSTDTSDEGIIYRGLVPHETIPNYLNACDVLALPYLRGRFIDSASSCKIAEYLACQRPIAATRSPNFVENFPVQARQLDTLLVPPGDPDALAQAIEHQLEKPTIASPPEEMTWESIAGRLRSSIEALQS